MIQRYILRRTVDISGVSGVGDVAEAAVFSNGWCVVCWTTRPDLPSLGVYQSLQDATEIHGHHGATQFIAQ